MKSTTTTKVLAAFLAVSLPGLFASVPAMALGIYTDNGLGNLSVVSPPDTAPVKNSPAIWTQVPGLSTLVQSRAGDNLEITVSAEIFTDSTVWLMASVDGAIIQPDVVFKRGGTFSDGSRSFTFAKQDVGSGTHSVAIHWFTNPGTSAQIGKRTLSVNSASPSWGKGGLAVAVPASGPAVVKSTASWEDIPGLSTTLTTAGDRNFKITFSAEAGPGIGRLFARALIDGAAVADVLFDAGANENGGTRSFTFVKSTVPAGAHTVTIQWLASGGQVRIGDRILTVAASPGATQGGGLVVRGFQGPPTAFVSTGWVDIPETAQSFTTIEPSANLQVAFGAEARTAGGSLLLRALVDGRPLSPGNITFVGAASGFRALSYSFVEKNILPGTHTVTMQASVTTGGFGEIEDRSVTVLFKRRAGADFAQPYDSLSPKSGGAPPVVVIGFDPRRPGVPQPTMTQLKNQHRGDDGGLSMRGWFLENSGGRYAPSDFTFLGWYDAPVSRRGTWYWDTGNFEMMHRDALIAANADFNFRQYDRNGDGYIDGTELVVVIARPQNNPYGTFRSLPAPLDGTTLTVRVVDMYMSAQEQNRTGNVGTLSHETSHAILGAADMHSTPYPTRAGDYSIMDEHSNATHLDPFHKLKSGFLTPDVVEINRWVTRTVSLAAVETKGEATIIYDPSKKDTEYFVVENRWGGLSTLNYDNHLSGKGVIVWHMIPDPALLLQFPSPGAINLPNLRGWAREGVRRLAVLTGFGDYINLNWADGSSTGIRVTLKDVPPKEVVSIEIAKL